MAESFCGTDDVILHSSVRVTVLPTVIDDDISKVINSHGWRWNGKSMKVS